jgi:GNAT superfamily N-acetyltransferase
MNPEFAFLVDRPDAVPCVIDWWYTSWADRMGEDRDQQISQLQASLGKIELPIHILALLEGRPVGSAALKLQELGDVFPDYQYWLGSVYVDAAFRGSKLASQLSQHIAEIARARKLSHLYLQTVDLSGGLYARLGWKPIQQFQFKGKESLLMLRQL